VLFGWLLNACWCQDAVQRVCCECMMPLTCSTVVAGCHHHRHASPGQVLHSIVEGSRAGPTQGHHHHCRGIPVLGLVLTHPVGRQWTRAASQTDFNSGRQKQVCSGTQHPSHRLEAQMHRHCPCPSMEPSFLLIA
jgi:hypothetical protein